MCEQRRRGNQRLIYRIGSRLLGELVLTPSDSHPPPSMSLRDRHGASLVHGEEKKSALCIYLYLPVFVRSTACTDHAAGSYLTV
jgi:hypothetical protein